MKLSQDTDVSPADDLLQIEFDCSLSICNESVLTLNRVNYEQWVRPNPERSEQSAMGPS